MQVTIKSVEQWGKVVGAVRKSQELDQKSAGEFSGSSINTIGGFEKGSGSMSVGRVFALMEALGLELKIDIALPEGDDEANRKLTSQIQQLVSNYD
jgi:transcriptional regulator with XRE-family HTH domain|tara:strand:- start:137 stop:424 length:288 start_codon:yes stop_codon:yes gene_type:complete